MQIFVKYSVIDGNSANSVIINKTATMFLSEMHKVHTIQRIMYVKAGIPPCFQRIIRAGGTQLDEEAALDDYGITEGETLECVVRGSGGLCRKCCHRTEE